MRTYDSSAAQGWSALVRTQSSLLLTIQAMHLDSVSTLRDRASEAIKQCTITKLQTPTSQARHDFSSDIEYHVHRRTTRCCYTIDILISNSTNQTVSADRFLEDNVSFCLFAPDYPLRYLLTDSFASRLITMTTLEKGRRLAHRRHREGWTTRTTCFN